MSAAVTFTTPFPDGDYIVELTPWPSPAVLGVYALGSQSPSGFTIKLYDSNGAPIPSPGTGFDWLAIASNNP
jgi:hypothetical protein